MRVVPNSSRAKSTNTAMVAADTRFQTANMMASVRMSRWRHSQRSPSAMSVRIRVGGPLRSTRNDPVRVSTNTAATPNDALSNANGVSAAAPNSSTPRGGPTKSRVMISTDWSRLLASSSDGRSTTDGRIAWDALSNIVSADPRQNATTQRIATEVWSVATTATSTAVTAQRNRSV